MEAFIRGVLDQGVDIVDLGLASTDLVYFAVSTLRPERCSPPHNPRSVQRREVLPPVERAVGQDTGLADIKSLAASVLSGNGPAPAARPGSATTRNLLSAFADHVVSFIDPAKMHPMRVVVDTANGMGGLVVPAVFERIPQISLEVMYVELDGTFPNHPADPLQPANQRDGARSSPEA